MFDAQKSRTIVKALERLDLAIKDLEADVSALTGEPAVFSNRGYLQTLNWVEWHLKGYLLEAEGTKFLQERIPDLESINRCSVMRDFGKQNKAILKMWQATNDLFVIIEPGTPEGFENIKDVVMFPLMRPLNVENKDSEQSLFSLFFIKKSNKSLSNA